jgi:hypothetical protein
LAHAEAHVAFALAKGCGRPRCSHSPLSAADADFIRALHYYTPLGGYCRSTAECAPTVQITEVCLRVKVYGGYHSGRVLDLPDTARRGDYIELPLDLPAGLMFQQGRSNPSRHETERTYQLTESTFGTRDKYLAVTQTRRMIRSVTVPPASNAGITISL